MPHALCPQLREINIYPGGGNVVLGLPGAEYPLEVSLAGPEALSLVSATGSLEQRRPSTLGTWTRSLLVRGVTVGQRRLLLLGRGLLLQGRRADGVQGDRMACYLVVVSIWCCACALRSEGVVG